MRSKRMFQGLIWLLFAVAGLSLVVMLLWNWLLPSLFGLVTINYWQALGILVLAKILFGRVGFGRHGHHWHGHGHGHGSFHHMGQKWHSMSPDERRNLVEQMRAGRHGHLHSMPGFCCAEAEQEEQAKKPASESE